MKRQKAKKLRLSPQESTFSLEQAPDSSSAASQSSTAETSEPGSSAAASSSDLPKAVKPYQIARLTETINKMLAKRVYDPSQSKRLTDFGKNSSAYESSARKNIEQHAQLVKLLLSSPRGLAILIQLVENGFTVFYPDTDHSIVHNYIKQATDLPPEDIGEFFTYLQQNPEMTSGLIKTATGDVDFKEKRNTAVYFHAGFILAILEKNIFRSAAMAYMIRNRQYTIFKILIQTEQFISADQNFQLFLAGGTYSPKISLKILPEFTRTDPALLQKKYMVWLDKCGTIVKENASLYEIIAIRAAKDLLLADFQMSKDELFASIEEHYNVACPPGSVIDVLLSQTIKEFAKHTCLKLSGSMAAHLLKSGFYSTLIESAKELKLCFDIVNYPDQPESGELKYKADSYHLFASNVRYAQPGRFTQAIVQIEQIFGSKKLFEPFLKELEQNLASRLPCKVPVDYHCTYGTIQLFNVNAPGINGFNWWLNLPNHQKKMFQAMHLLLLDLENIDGYNLPEPDGSEGVPRFHGFIPKEEANTTITAGFKLFKEDSRALESALHGIESHRIQFAALRYFIRTGQITLPPGAAIHDLLTFIVDNNLWGSLFDGFGTNFNSPHYLMSYLRNADDLPALQQYAHFNLFSVMKKTMDLHGIDYNEGYEQLLMLQLCAGSDFKSHLSSEPFLNWFKTSGHTGTPAPHQSTSGWYCIFRKNRKQAPSAPSSSTCDTAVPSTSPASSSLVSFFAQKKIPVEQGADCHLRLPAP
ncbi:hypothetical protein [Legionella sp. CNM-4043-24]|uniref:hypothetical protein n=1 Tax=Legionella sp. CNM-4043-24 TaxID=3421646 RepID=UPI00403B1D52